MMMMKRKKMMRSIKSLIMIIFRKVLRKKMKIWKVMNLK